MTRRPDGLPDYPAGFSALNRTEVRRLARIKSGAPRPLTGKRERPPPTMPGVMRLWLEAVGRMNRAGHAEFAERELATILGDGSTPMDSSQLRGLINDAKLLGLIGHESSARCVVIPEHQAAFGVGGATCRWHRLGVSRRKRQSG